MREHIPQLDSVRGVAILVVLAHNLHGFTSPPFSYLTRFGWMGVDLFFVLSGFLITGILLDTKSSKNYFRNFYARRCLRIWPLYYSILVLMFVAVPLIRPQNAAEIFHRSQRWTAWSNLVARRRRALLLGLAVVRAFFFGQVAPNSCLDGITVFSPPAALFRFPPLVSLFESLLPGRRHHGWSPAGGDCPQIGFCAWPVDRSRMDCLSG